MSRSTFIFLYFLVAKYGGVVDSYAKAKQVFICSTFDKSLLSRLSYFLTI